MEYSDALSQEVWHQIESFAGYSFSKAHSASLAVESYQSLFVKTYYPREFMVAVINNFGGFYSPELYFHELQRSGAILEAPCVNRSEELTFITGINVFVGFVHIENLESKIIENILEERQSGLFEDLADFIERTAIGLQQLNALIRTDAFRFTGISKKELLWQANFLHKKTKSMVPTSQAMFHEQPVNFQLPALSSSPRDDLMDELELLGFPLSNIFKLAAEDARALQLAATLPQFLGEEVTMLLYFVTNKPVRTVSKTSMFFDTFLDADGYWVDTVHFRDSNRNYPFQGKGFYKITGKVVVEFGVYSVEVWTQKKVGLQSNVKSGNTRSHQNDSLVFQIVSDFVSEYLVNFALTAVFIQPDLRFGAVFDNRTFTKAKQRVPIRFNQFNFKYVLATIA